MTTNKIFTEEEKNNLFGKPTSDIIFSKMKEGNFSFILNGICYIKEDSLVINYKFFKHFAGPQTYEIINQYLVSLIDTILQQYSSFAGHLNMNTLTVTQLDKHRKYLTQLAGLLQQKYPDTLSDCYVYDASFIFSQLLNIISLFVDKVTLNKIQIVNRI